MKKEFNLNIKLNEKEKSSLLKFIDKLPNSKTFLVGKTFQGDDVVLAEVSNDDEM
ncbi:hypothetical protein [Empedobacter sp.]|uniref:hypothetical protein n=1 Tax=Empedobacter sp. TaxID=1927715 RepID=UPI00289EB93A|nr:hypothetical protein [Empedobacter sp.]